jgi:magnesium transporter
LAKKDHGETPVVDLVRKDFSLLSQDLSISEALAELRRCGCGERIVYFYASDEKGRLVGVLPTRRLLTTQPDAKIRDVMVRNVISIPASATAHDACEYFVLHRLLAFPVVKPDGVPIGVVEVDQFTDEVFDLAAGGQSQAIFEALGFRIKELKRAGAAGMFRLRFPWLAATVLGGTFCALIAASFEHVLAKSLVLAYFLPLVLALGESVSMQSMTVTIQALQAANPSVRWYRAALWRETKVAFLLAWGIAALVAVIVVVLRRDVRGGFVVGATVAAATYFACFLGLTVPWLLHARKLDPKIAAGPVALVTTDICTLLFYFSLGALLL